MSERGGRAAAGRLRRAGHAGVPGDRSPNQRSGGRPPGHHCGRPGKSAGGREEPAATGYGEPPRRASAPVERIAQPREETLLAGREPAGGRLLAAQLRQLTQQPLLLSVELDRRLDPHVDDEVATA